VFLFPQEQLHTAIARQWAYIYVHRKCMQHEPFQHSHGSQRVKANCSIPANTAERRENNVYRPVLLGYTVIRHSPDYLMKYDSTLFPFVPSRLLRAKFGQMVEQLQATWEGGYTDNSVQTAAEIGKANFNITKSSILWLLKRKIEYSKSPGRLCTKNQLRRGIFS
jgi:hypothetical protein